MVELTVRRLGHKGDGIADGPVFVPRSLPGETVSGRMEGTQLSDVRIVTPSAERVAPVCRHFNACGGCQMQHASDAFLERWKSDVVRGALEAHGLETEMLTPHVSPAQSRRRATLSARRTKKGAMAGFHARASEVITEIPDCRLLHPDLVAAIPAVEALTIAGASRKAALSVTITRSEGGIDAVARGGKPLGGRFGSALAVLADAHDLARLTWEDETVVTRRAPVQRFGTVEVVPPPGAFLQATAEGEAAILASVMQAIEGAASIADLFAGCGTFCLPLARRVAVHAVEGDRAMVAALDLGWRRAEGLRAVSSEARDLYRRPLEPDELSRFDAVVIDPPRAGAQAQVERLAESCVSRIAYVSCHPVSFARDAKRLVDAGYRLDWCRTIDQFRWSSHVELVAAFGRD